MIDTKRIISISEARKNIFSIVDEVQIPGHAYLLTADGNAKAVIMSAEEYESMVETLEVMRDFPDIHKAIAETDDAIRTGEYKNWTTLEDLKREWKIPTHVSETTKRKYAVHTTPKPKGKKRAR